LPVELRGQEIEVLDFILVPVAKARQRARIGLAQLRVRPGPPRPLGLAALDRPKQRVVFQPFPFPAGKACYVGASVSIEPAVGQPQQRGTVLVQPGIVDLPARSRITGCAAFRSAQQVARGQQVRTDEQRIAGICRIALVW